MSHAPSQSTFDRARSGPVVEKSETMFDSDQEIFDFVKRHLRVPAICDILDSLGFKQQGMHQRLRPLNDNMNRCGFVGRARTLRWMETDYVVGEDPYGLEIEAIDSLKPGDVVVHSTDYAATSAPWGELMTTVAKRNGAVGCVCDGNVRDCKQIVDMDFPVYCAGIRPTDSKGRARVMAFDVEIRCGEVIVRPEELVFADFDGVVVVPRKVEEKVLSLAKEKLDDEDRARADILSGQSLRSVYNTYGIL